MMINRRNLLKLAFGMVFGIFIGSELINKIIKYMRKEDIKENRNSDTSFSTNYIIYKDDSGYVCAKRGSSYNMNYYKQF